MVSILLSLVLLCAGGLAATGLAYVLVRQDFLFPQWIRAADAIGLSRRAVLLGAFTLYLAFGVFLVVAGLLGWPTLALGSMWRWVVGNGTDTVNLIETLTRLNLVVQVSVMVLVLMAMWSATVAVERLFAFNRAREQSANYAPQVSTLLREGRLEDAIALSAAPKFKDSHLARVVSAALHEYKVQRESGRPISREEMLDLVTWSIRNASHVASARLQRGLSTLATIGSVAPFIGLLGTVSGIITAFARVSGGNATLAVLSTGVAEALANTALGLFVAIPAVWLYNYFKGRLEYFGREMSDVANEATAFVQTRLA